MEFPRTYFLLRLILVIWAGLMASPSYADKSVSLYMPPDTLKEWYQPANKRQVWLHTMFRLRREMQAISEYASLNDQVAQGKWMKRLEKDYNEIAEMLPEWKDKIKPRLLEELEGFIEEGDMPRVGRTLNMIQRTCDDCHSDYQPLVAAIYRSPHYQDIKIKDLNGHDQSFEDSMVTLSKSINRILIALDDGQKSTALEASKSLGAQLQNLGDGCEVCHKNDAYPRERILGEATKKNLATLESTITEWKVKDSQELMGKIAVTVCARCHNTHRIVHDLRGALLPE